MSLLIGKAEHSSVIAEINEITSKGKAPSAFDLLQGRASKSDEESEDFGDVLAAFANLSLDRSDKGELVPAVMRNKRVGAALKEVSTYSLQESPTKLLERLDLIKPFFSRQFKAPLGAMAKASDTYLKICAQISFILMFATMDLEQFDDQNPVKEQAKQKQVVLFKKLQTHTAVIEKVFKARFELISKDGNWMVKTGPLLTHVQHILVALMPPA